MRYHHTGRPKKPLTRPVSAAVATVVSPSGGRRSLSALLIRFTANSSTGAPPAAGATDHRPHLSNGPTVSFVLPSGSFFVEPSGAFSTNSPLPGNVTSAVAPVASDSRSSPWLVK